MNSEAASCPETDQIKDFNKQHAGAEALLHGTIEADEGGTLVEEHQYNKELQQQEVALRESEAKYRLLFNSSGDAIFIHDMDQRILAVNQQACQQFGYTNAELTAMKVNQIDVPTEIEHIPKRIAQLVAEGQVTFESVHQRKDGTLIPNEVRAALISWDGQPAIMSICRDITERRQAEEKLKESEQRFKTIFNESPVSIYIHDKDTGEIVDANEAAWKIAGLESLGELQKNEFWIDPPYSRVDALERIHKAAAEGMQRFEWKVRKITGTFCWLQVILTPIFIDGIERVLVTALDISDRKDIEEQLYNEKEQLKTTLISVGDGVISTDTQGQVLIMNKIAEQLTGWTRQEAVGQPIEAVYDIINEVTRAKCDNPVTKVLATEQKIEHANHILLIAKDGIERSIEDSAAPIIDERGNVSGVVLVFRDFTEKKKSQDEIKYLSFHDHLTGLYNRRFYEEELTRIDTPRNWPLTIVMGDVNGLKLINDSFGHGTGDQLLIKTAAALTRCCRADDIIARIGGDEFVILFPNTDGFEAAQLIKRIKNLLKNESVENLEISVSFGYETKISAADDIEEVFKKAEDAMYHNKLFEGPGIKGRVIDNIFSALNRKSNSEQVHARHVSEGCERMGVVLGLDEHEIKKLKIFGLLHDIGKIAISDATLNKSGTLSEAEWIEMKNHSEIGYRILSTNKDMTEIAAYVLSHHERWDGKGYPKGLKGEAIPLASRICAIVEAYDAMISERKYRSSLTEDVASAELRNNAGTQFDPALVRKFIDTCL